MHQPPRPPQPPSFPQQFMSGPQQGPYQPYQPYQSYLPQQQFSTPPPPPPHKHTGRNLGIGCGVLLIALFVCVLIGSHTASSIPPTASSAPTATTRATLARHATQTPTHATQTALTPTATQGRLVPTPTSAPTATPTAVPTQPPAPPPSPTVPPAPTGVNGNPWGYNFVFGNLIYTPPATFCDYFNCIASFWMSTNGYVDECADGTYSHSGGVRGDCSHHGGQQAILYSH